MIRYSVIIPCWNAHDWVRAALDSCYGKPDTEVILVDDYSDRPYGYLLEDYPNVNLIRLPRWMPTGRVRNYGLEQAQGKWVTFLDSDDELTDDFFNNYYEPVDADILVFNVIDEAGDCTWTVFDDTFHGKWYSRQFLKEHHIHFHRELYVCEDIYFQDIVKHYVEERRIARLDASGYIKKANPRSVTNDGFKDVIDWLDKHYHEIVHYRLAAELDNIVPNDSGSDIDTKKVDGCLNSKLGWEYYEDYYHFTHYDFELTSDIGPLLTIVIPLYNSEEYLATTLSKFMDLFHKSNILDISEVEMIFTDDDSDSEEGITEVEDIIEDAFKEDCDKPYSYKILRNSTRLYMGGNRDRGLKIARGRYITFMDHDDELIQEGMEDAWQKMEAEEFDTTKVFRYGQNNLGILEYTVHGEFYPIRMMREYDIQFPLALRTSEDVFMHNRLEYMASVHKEIEFVDSPSINSYNWVYNRDSMYNSGGGSETYVVAFLLDGIRAWMYAYDGCEFTEMQDIMQRNFQTWANLMEHDDGLTQKNIKILASAGAFAALNDRFRERDFNGDLKEDVWAKIQPAWKAIKDIKSIRCRCLYDLIPRELHRKYYSHVIRIRK